MEDNVFKLDSDFDFIVADDTISALHVSGFDKIAEMDDGVRSAAVENVAQLATVLPTIAFDNMLEYVSTHKRAARIVSSLRARQDLAATPATNLKRACKLSRVAVQMIDGRLHADAGHEMSLLKLLDRRLYTAPLICGQWEQYEAASRREVGVHYRERTAAPAAGRRGVLR